MSRWRTFRSAAALRAPFDPAYIRPAGGTLELVSLTPPAGSPPTRGRPAPTTAS